MRELELSGRLSVGGHAHGVNRRDWAGETDGRDVVRRDGHGDDDALVEREALNDFGRRCECDGYGQQDEETKEERKNNLSKILLRRDEIGRKVIG